MRIGVRVPPCRPATEIAAFAADVEAAGFDTMYVPDSQLLWRDAYVTLHAAATRTSRLGLATAVSNVVTRHPSVVAGLSRTVAEAAPGRFTLGLGVGHSSVEPVGLRPSTGAELRQGLAQVRELLSGKEFAGARLRDPSPGVPIHVAATGPRNLRLAGEIADGAILLSGVAPALVSRAVGLVAEGARSAGRDPAGLAIVLSAYAMVTDDLPRDARMLKPVCAAIAQRGGRAALAAAGIHVDVPATVPGVHPDLVHAEDWAHAVDVCGEWVTDDDAVAFARTFCLFGTPAEITERVATAASLGATAVFLQHVGSYDLPERLVADFAELVLDA